MSSDQSIVDFAVSQWHCI